MRDWLRGFWAPLGFTRWMVVKIWLSYWLLKVTRSPLVRGAAADTFVTSMVLLQTALADVTIDAIKRTNDLEFRLTWPEQQRIGDLFTDFLHAWIERERTKDPDGGATAEDLQCIVTHFVTTEPWEDCLDRAAAS
jgi:hypothetical protein